MSQPDSRAVIDAAQTLIRAESDAVRDVAEQIDDTFVRVAGLLLELEGKVVVTGAGTSGFIARRGAHLLSVTGTPAFFLNPTDGLHGSMGALSAGDVLIALSKGGTSVEVNDLAQRVQSAGVHVVALTCNPDGALAGLADIPVVLRPCPDADPGSLIAMGSTLAAGSYLDALAFVLMRARRFSWATVHHIHPGGAVGQADRLPDDVDALHLPTGGSWS